MIGSVVVATGVGPGVPGLSTNTCGLGPITGPGFGGPGTGGPGIDTGPGGPGGPGLGANLGGPGGPTNHSAISTAY